MGVVDKELPNEDCALIGLHWPPSESNEFEVTLARPRGAKTIIKYSWVEDLHIDLRLEAVFRCMTKRIEREISTDSQFVRYDFGSDGMITFKCKGETLHA